MDCIKLEKRENGKVFGAAEFSGIKYSGESPDMELAAQWATDLEECVRSGKTDETGKETDC